MNPSKTSLSSGYILASTVALLVSASALRAVPPTYTTPHIITGDSPNTATLGDTIFINHGLVETPGEFLRAGEREAGRLS